MNRKFLVMLAAAIPASVFASDYEDTAKVISSKPVYERVSEPKQECWTETVTSTGTVVKSAPVEERSIGGALLGGVIGGVVGSQIGQGNGNTIATGAGAIAGAIIGDRVANKDAQQSQTTTQEVPQTREERRCRQVENYREVLRGYDVTYRYGGRDITTRMSRQPGDTVRVGIGVVGGDVTDDTRTRGGRADDAREYGERGRDEKWENEDKWRDRRDRRYGE